MSTAQNNDTDIISICILLWNKKKLIIRNCAIAFVLAVVVAFSIPKEYTSEISVAPELYVSESGLGSLTAMAQMVGVDMGESLAKEAIYPDLYPEIVSSTPFLVDLLSLQVETKDGEIKTDMYDYLMHHQKEPWWSMLVKGAKDLFKGKSEGEDVDIREANSMQFTREQILLLESFASMLDVKMSKTTSLMTVSATMQDPLVAAIVAQAIAEKLQLYVDKYHTAKERENVAYLENLYKESMEKYKAVQKEYISYTDSHLNPLLASVKVKQSDLENEMQLAYSISTQVFQQLETANARLQEKKPIMIVVQPATVPFKASSPKKLLMVFIYVFFAFFFTSAWIIVRNILMSYFSNNLLNEYGIDEKDKEEINKG